jgi:hypothetical protein
MAMDTTTFDTLVRTVSATTTRRATLRGLVAGAASLAAGGLLLGSDDAEARRRRRGKKGRKTHKQQGGKAGGTLPPGTRCQRDAQCPTGAICAVPVNGSNSDRYCSGGQGAMCGAPNEDGDDTFPYCAVGFRCTPDGTRSTCQAEVEAF